MREMPIRLRAFPLTAHYPYGTFKSMAQDDGTLIERCIRRDPLAWAELVNKYSKLITLSIERILKKYSYAYSAHDVEDISQNVLASVWKDNKLAGIRNRADISYWFSIVSAHTAVNYMRARLSRADSNAVSLHAAPEGDCPIAGAIASIASREPTQRDAYAQREAAECVEKSLAELGERERLIMKLNLFHQKTHAEIAAIMGIPAGTASSAIKRAKEKLKASVKKYMQEF